MIVDTKWFGLWHSWVFELTYNVCGYFDPHPEIHISLLGLHFMFRLPWKNKGWEDECMPPQYGIMIHDSALWIHYGGKGNLNGGNKYLCWRLPFFTGVHMDDKWMVETVNGMVPTNVLETPRRFRRTPFRGKGEFLSLATNHLHPSRHAAPRS